MKGKVRMDYAAHSKTLKAVCRTGAKTGSVLEGMAKNNKGLRLRIMEDQVRSPGGPISGGFHILDVGKNKYSKCLETHVGQATDADQVVRTLRQEYPQCVNIVNSNILVLEQEMTFSALGVPSEPANR
jgi:hypothetical protein